MLGPLLFLAYINDLPESVKSDVRLFADDCLLYRTINSEKDARTLQKGLDGLTQWQNDWQMRFNASKCYVMHLSKKRNNIEKDYTLNNCVIGNVKHQAYLGVQLSDDLKWSHHIRTATKILGVVRRNLRLCSRILKETAYKTLVRPHLEYASTVWDPHLKKDINSLDRVQRSAARFVSNNYDYSEGYMTSILKDLNWDSLVSRRTSARLIMLYKIVNGLVAVKDSDYIKASSRRTRNTNTLKFHLLQHDVMRMLRAIFPGQLETGTP